MKIYKYKSFNESKNKFPNIKTLNVDGFVVYLGRDAKSNDHLTFNMSNPDDIWMHTKGVPGSHMLILVRDKIPTPETIKIVAEIAKKNSKAKDNHNIAVVYCKVKFVKKEPGMNDGQVRVDYNNSNEVIIN